MRYKNEGDTRHELKILLAAAVVSVLAAVTAAGLVPVESAAGEADGQQAHISGDYSYTVKADGTAEITGYSGSGSDAGRFSETVEAYRRGLAGADRALAAVCDRVVEISAGMEEIWK